jgi:hypothetical protein
MGKSITPKYRLEYYDNNRKIMPYIQGWSCKEHGRPTDKTLEKYLYSLGKSFEIGGVNKHISKSKGFILYPCKGYIIEQKTNQIVATWKAPMFMVW